MPPDSKLYNKLQSYSSPMSETTIVVNNEHEKMEPTIQNLTYSRHSRRAATLAASICWSLVILLALAGQPELREFAYRGRGTLLVAASRDRDFLVKLAHLIPTNLPSIDSDQPAHSEHINTNENKQTITITTKATSEPPYAHFRHDHNNRHHNSYHHYSQNHRYHRNNRRQQVPEQSPVLVSSCDTSYVSSSPILETGTQKTRLQRHSLVSKFNGHHRSSERRHQQRGVLLNDNQIPKASNAPLDLQTNEDDLRSTSRSDISTTATTTQRNRHITHNLIQSDPNEESALSHDISQADGNDRLQLDLLRDQFEQRKGSRHQAIDTNFHIKTATIIKRRESIDMGATFINYTIVTNLNACLVECWITDSCDTAIYHEMPIDLSNPLGTLSQDRELLMSLSFGTNNWTKVDLDVYRERMRQPERGFFICYLYECAKQDGFKCQFASHNFSVSSISKQASTPFNFHDTIVEDLRGPEVTHHPVNSRQQVEMSNEINQQMTESFNCEPEQFQCITNNQCIPDSHRCDGIIHCADCSDEDACYDDVAITSDTHKTAQDRYNKVKNHQTSPHLSRVSSKSPFTDVTVETTMRIEPMQGGVEFDIETSSRSSSDYYTIDGIKQTSVQLNRIKEPTKQLQYSHIVRSDLDHPTINKKGHYHDKPHIAIRIEHDDHYERDRGGLNSALIAIMFGIGVTGILIVIVSHKMNSIKSRLAYKSRRRSLVPDTDYLIHTIPI